MGMPTRIVLLAWIDYLGGLNMKKHWAASIFAILASFLLVSVVGLRLAHASDEPVRITNAKVTDLNSVSLDGKTITDTNKVRFSFSFAMDKNVVANQPYEIGLDPIIVYDTGATPIQLVSGDISIGVVNVTSGKAIITLNNNVKTLTNIRGNFSFVAGFDKNRIDYVAGNDIELPGPEKNPHLNFRRAATGSGSGESLVSKTLTYDANDPTIINWSVTINNKGTAIDDAVLVDQLEMSQEYVPGSTSINYRNWNRKIIKRTHENLMFNNQRMEQHFGTLIDADLEQDNDVTSIVVRYQTRITDNGVDKKYPNSATLLDGPNVLQTVKTSASWRGQTGGGQGDQVTTFTATKHWQDEDNADGLRPDAIKVHLLADGTEVANQTLTEATNWQFTFVDLPKYVNGHEIVYTITEDKVAQYETTIAGGDITNTHIVTKPELPGPDEGDNPDTPGPSEEDKPELPGPDEGDNPDTPGPSEEDKPELPGPDEGDNPDTPGPDEGDKPDMPGPSEEDKPDLPEPDKGAKPGRPATTFPIVQRPGRVVHAPQTVPSLITRTQSRVPHRNLQDALPATGDETSWQMILVGGLITLISLSGYYVIKKQA